MKIAIFTGTILLTRSDARSIYIVETLRYLVRFNDLEIVVISPNEIPDEFKGKVTHISYLLYDRQHFRKFSALFTSFPKMFLLECDMIHCYEREAATIALIARKIRRNRIPIIFEIMGLEAGESVIKARSSIVAKILKPYNIWMERIIIKNSNCIFALTDAVRKYIIQNYKISDSKVITIPHGVDVELFSKKSKKDEVLINILNLRDKKVIVYTGALLPLNGVLDLVKAMKIVNNRMKNVICIIVGKGYLEKSINKFIIENQLTNVVLTGYVPHKEIPKYLNIADILVNPDVRCLQTELDIPTKLFEYLASGKPIVSSNLPSIAEIVKDNAILVESENPQSFAEGILSLLNDELLRKKMGTNGRKIVLDYTWEKTADKTYEGYNKVIIAADKLNN